ncbi:ribonuclease P protein component [Fontimonas thermophila]|uniref:Ribonuclease P protein component n=1 Tax=Fontimonas thermophila TaxID=1076937 RepID=A0A1I2H7C2_9GAMM|nr:ribonuclease P protein component [Fontimonas thermophila]SFF25250.1 ribonuclease P protein component [Fontimonas thermophila]
MARFTRRARLSKPGDFDTAFERGRRIQERHLTAIVVANALGHPRLGLAIARKSVALATQRNRIKRVIRESFRMHQHELGALDIVILARPGCAHAGAAGLNRSLERLWSRIAALSASSSSA